MKSLVVTSVLLSLFSLRPDVAPADLHTKARERIQELVVEPLRERSVFWRPSAFSRAAIATKPAEFRLWTSPELEDADERRFVRFRVEEADNERGMTFTGCYYVATDTAFIDLEGMDGVVLMEDHPWLTLRSEVPVVDETRCRAEN